MNKQLANYFLSEKVNLDQTEQYSETKIIERKANLNIERLSLMAKSNRKCH